MSDNKIVLAISGLPGAGKSETTDYLMKKLGWSKVYFGQTVIDEIGRRELEATEENHQLVREDLRKEHGMGAIAMLNLPKIREQYKAGSVLLESFYSWADYLIMKKEFGDSFKVLAIHASPAIREERMKNRPTRALLSREAFEQRDFSQIGNIQQAGPIARADFMVINESSKDELFQQLDNVIKKLS